MLLGNAARNAPVADPFDAVEEFADQFHTRLLSLLLSKFECAGNLKIFITRVTEIGPTAADWLIIDPPCLPALR